MLKLGDSGPLVGALQQHLLEQGLHVVQSELNTNTFGAATEAALKTFQASQKLIPDGVCGPKTQAALDHPVSPYVTSGFRYDSNDASAKLRPVTNAAYGEIGQHEIPDGSNKVAGDRYGNGTDPWCAYFVSWCFRFADQGSPFGRKVGAAGIYDWAMRRGLEIKSYQTALPGDVFVILRAPDANGERHGHTGLVVGVLPDKRLVCVEGNAGNAVRGTIRDRDGLTALLRPLS